MAESKAIDAIEELSTFITHPSPVDDDDGGGGGSGAMLLMAER